MAINFDKSIGLHSAALLLREQRSSLLASNIANGDTPGFKAKDIDFKQALEQVTQAIKSDSSYHSNNPLSNDLIKYRIPNQPDTGDGNSVDVQQEKMEFARNAMDYQVVLGLLDSRVKGMIRALRGE